MTPHYRSLDELIEAAPPSGPLGGPGVTSGRRTYALVDILGSTWKVAEETLAHRLVDLRKYIASGADPIRITEGGTRALATGGDPDHLYLYEQPTESRPTSTTGSRSHGLCCFVAAPVGSECSNCGEVVAPR